MQDILQPILELGVLLPGVVLAYLPMGSHLRQPPKKLLLWMGPLCLAQVLVGGAPVLGSETSYFAGIDPGSLCDRPGLCPVFGAEPVEIRQRGPFRLRGLCLSQGHRPGL